MTPQLNQLLKELDTLEFDIDKLISMNSSASLLDTKLSQLASSVAAIPAEQASLKNEWQRRMDILWQKHREVNSQGLADFDWAMAPEEEEIHVDVVAPSKQVFSDQQLIHENLPKETENILSSLSQKNQEVISQGLTDFDWAIAPEQEEIRDEMVAPSKQAFSEQELSERESVILKLLNMKPLASEELGRKISEFAETVAHIPPEYPELTNKWNTKAKELMEKLQVANSTLSCAGDTNLSLFASDQQPIHKNLAKETQNISSSSQKNLEANSQGLADFNWAMAPEQEEIPVDMVANSKQTFSEQEQQPIFKNLPNETENISSSLSQKLDTTESAIVRMLELNPRPSDALEEKISELVESVGNIPAENDQLVKEWSDRLGIIMDKFFSNGENCDVQPYNQRSTSLEDLHQCLDTCHVSGDKVEPIDCSTTFEMPKFDSKPSNDNQIDQPAYSSNYGNDYLAKNDNYDSNSVKNSGYQHESSAGYGVNANENTGNGSYPTGGYGNDGQNEANQGNYFNQNTGSGYNGYGNERVNRRDEEENDPELRAAKEEIFSKIKPAFNRFRPARNETDLRGFRILLLLVAKARRLVDSYRGYRVPLYGEVFSLAHSKLSSDMQSKCDPEMNLNGLFQFLNNHIRDTMEAQFAAREVDEFAMCFSCSFCRVTGHNNNACPRIRSMFCLNCFQFGHQKSRCCNETVRPEDIHF